MAVKKQKNTRTEVHPSLGVSVLFISFRCMCMRMHTNTPHTQCVQRGSASHPPRSMAAFLENAWVGAVNSLRFGISFDMIKLKHHSDALDYSLHTHIRARSRHACALERCRRTRCSV